MATNQDVFDDFLAERGHETDCPGWNTNYNKKQCPECMSLHASTAVECSVCDWTPR